MRTVSWFSCGVASAVATKLACVDGPIVIANCEIIEEHPDNYRFLKDCEKWFGQEIVVLGNDKYNRSVHGVIDSRSYIAGHAGAPCTLELKKKVRLEYEQPNDTQVFGYTAEEQGRADRFIDANNEVNLDTPLIDRGLTKPDCLAMVQDAGIELPVMYRLGYKNNNCRGCVKAQSPAYWKKIQIDFPEHFEKMAKQEARLGVKICKATVDGVADVRMPLTELPEWINPMDDSVDIQCGIFCEMAEQEYRNA